MVISTLRKRSQPACTRDKIAKKNTDIGAAKVGPAMAGPVPPPLLTASEKRNGQLGS